MIGTAWFLWHSHNLLLNALSSCWHLNLGCQIYILCSLVCIVCQMIYKLLLLYVIILLSTINVTVCGRLSGVIGHYWHFLHSMQSRVYVTVGCLSAGRSVCYISWKQQQCAAGLLLSTGTCSRCRLISVSAALQILIDIWCRCSAANVGSVMLRGVQTDLCCITRSLSLFVGSGAQRHWETC